MRNFFRLLWQDRRPLLMGMGIAIATNLTAFITSSLLLAVIMWAILTVIVIVVYWRRIQRKDLS